MKRALVLIAALAAAAIAAPAGAGGDPPEASSSSSSSVTVKLRDSFFSPRSLTVARGTVVRFVWAGRLVHNLTGPGIPARYARTRLRGSYSRSFSRGTRRFACTIHPGMGMRLRVR